LFEGEVKYLENHRQERYKFINDVPVLIDFSKSALNPERYMENQVTEIFERKAYEGVARLVKKILSPSGEVTKKNVSLLAKLLAAKQNTATLLVIGGGSIGKGTEELYANDRINILSFDIYYSPNVDFIADAHQIPLQDNSVDGDIIQAVLEHVLDPQVVVNEIERVLKPGGYVYAETPFMQPVHEGAYDFTRYTESGHIFLFRNFSKIRSGINGGAGLTLLWSIDYFFRGLFRSVAAGKFFKLLFFWVRFFDAIIPNTFNVDAANGVFFLGHMVAENEKIDIEDIYEGALQGERQISY
jgi:SAM-dependent methyltransferase